MFATNSYSRLMLVLGCMMLLFGITSVDNTFFIGRYSEWLLLDIYCYIMLDISVINWLAPPSSDSMS
jgi:hypothetical protein